MKRFAVLVLMVLVFSTARSQFVEQLHLISYPVDSYKLKVHTTFLQDVNFDYPPHLSGYSLVQQNDTLKLQLYYLIPVVIGQIFGATVVSTITLGEFNASSGINYLTIYPHSVDSSLPDTTAFIQTDTTLLLPWVNSISSPGNDAAWEISPNPATDVLTVRFSGRKKEKALCTVRSITGISIVSKELYGGNANQIPLPPDLPNGLYTVELVSGEFRQIKKFIIHR